MDPLCASLFSKISEQIELSSGLARLAPAGKEDWRPPAADHARPLWTMAELLNHLDDCMAGFLAVLLRLRPAELAHFANYRGQREAFETYRREIQTAFQLLTDADLASTIPTIFVPQGEPALTLLLGNLEHLVNHKQQLFLYLRMLGVPVGTPDLYRLRG
jgi:uncharacterized damage-inducible protein DinB